MGRGRRRRLVAAILAALGLLAMLAFASWRGRDASIVERIHVFGSYADIEIRGADPDRAAAAIAALAALWNRYHRDWHPWEPGALATLNRALARGELSDPLPVSLVRLIEAGRAFERESDGLLNPAMGRLVAAWGFHRSKYPVRAATPDSATLAQLLASAPSMQDVVLEGTRARSRNPDVQLDFSSLAEGLALADAGMLLQRHGIDRALLAMGGDVMALGRHRDRPWTVALRGEAGVVVARIELDDGWSLFASGGASRYRVDADGSRRPHLIDPRSGAPTEDAYLSAVMHRDPLRADAAATALAIGGLAEAPRLLRSMEIACALLVDADGTVHATAGMRAHLLPPANRDAVLPLPGDGRCAGVAAPQTDLRDNAFVPGLPP